VFRAAIPTSRATWGGSEPNRPEAISSNEPWIDVSGVRSSWLTTETKSRRARSVSCSHWLACSTEHSS
jgi:hypothetical protein